LQNKQKYLLEGPPTKGTTTYNDWVASDFSVMTWLLNNIYIHEKFSVSVIFLKVVKEMHDTLKEMYSNEQNISCVADLYEQLFSLTE